MMMALKNSDVMRKPVHVLPLSQPPDPSRIIIIRVLEVRA